MSQTTTQIQTLNPPLQILATAAPPPDAPIPQFANFNYYLPPPLTGSSSSGGVGAEPSTDDLELILGARNQDTRRLPVHDLRGRFADFALDRCGFQAVKLEEEEGGDMFEPDDDEWVRRVYYRRIEDVVRGLYPDLKEILHLGHILRGALPRTDFSGPTDPAWNKPARACAPATRAHIDFTHHGVRLVLEQEFGAETAARVCDGGRRFVALSLWKPLKPVRRDPLGFCDGRTVDKQDLVVLRRVYPDGREGENVLVKARAEGRGVHDWYWVSGQRTDELVVLKLFDGERVGVEVEGRCAQTPHASFTLEGSEEVREVRESVEVRVVVCF